MLHDPPGASRDSSTVTSALPASLDHRTKEPSMTGMSVSAHDECGAGREDTPHQAPAAEPAGWVIWQAPGRGYIALEGDLPPIADALEALWFLRAQRHIIDMLPGARGRMS